MARLIDPKDAFIHVVYEYRCLVRAEFGFTLSAKKQSINNDIPEIGTISRNAVLSKTRSLILFYQSPSWPTDLTCGEYFNGYLQTVDQTLYSRLTGLRASMEMHDLHLTAWREPAYRSTHSDPRGRFVDRIDWDQEQSVIVDDIVKSLKVIAPSLDAKWEKAFLHLHDTCQRVLKSGGDWASDLSTPANILSYLASLGL